MRTVNGQAMRLVHGILVLGAVCVPTGAAAHEPAARVTVEHRAADRKWIVEIELPDSSTPGAERRLVTEIQALGMLHRFQAGIFNKQSGQPVESDAPWGATIFAAKSDAESWLAAPPSVRLSTGAPEVRIARPYGMQLDAGAPMTIVAALPVSNEPGTVLRITIEYEAAPATRFPAVLIASEETVATDSWTWRAEVSGKLVMISGRLLADAETLVLEDLTTGLVIWQSPPRLLRGAVIRPIAVVEAGRRYRLRATYSSAVQEQAHGGDTPLAIVTPRHAARGQR